MACVATITYCHSGAISAPRTPSSPQSHRRHTRSKQRTRHRPRKYKHVNKSFSSSLNATAMEFQPTPPSTPSGYLSPADPSCFSMPASPYPSAPGTPRLGRCSPVTSSLPVTPSGSMLNLDSGMGSSVESVLCESLASLVRFCSLAPVLPFHDELTAWLHLIGMYLNGISQKTFCPFTCCVHGQLI